MVQEKLAAVNTALAHTNSPVVEIGRHGFFTIGKGFPVLPDRTVGKEVISIYTAPKEPTPPEQNKLNELLEKIIHLTNLTPDATEVFMGGLTQLVGKNYYNDLTLGILFFAERQPGNLELNPTISKSRNDQEINGRLARLNFEPSGGLRLQTGIYVHVLPNERLARLLLMKDQGSAPTLPDKAYEKLPAYEVEKIVQGTGPYSQIKIPGYPNKSSL